MQLFHAAKQTHFNTATVLQKSAGPIFSGEKPIINAKLQYWPRVHRTSGPIASANAPLPTWQSEKLSWSEGWNSNEMSGFTLAFKWGEILVVSVS